jgi:thymidine phosphorylase
VPSVPLIVASIMSKKLALGAATLVLDVKWGRGAFRTTVAEAHELASALRRVAREAGVACEALLTDMNQPLGPALGTASEVRAALDVLAGRGDRRLREVSLRLCQQAMGLRGIDVSEARSRLESSLASGEALASWNRMVSAHGGDPDPDRLPQPRERHDVVAAADGFISGIAADSLGRIAAAAGAGRSRRDQALAFGAGIIVHGRIGDRVEAKQPLATLEVGDRPVDITAMSRRIAAAFEISDRRPQVPELVLGTVDEVDPGS